MFHQYVKVSFKQKFHSHAHASATKVLVRNVTQNMWSSSIYHCENYVIYQMTFCQILRWEEKVLWTFQSGVFHDFALGLESQFWLIFNFIDVTLLIKIDILQYIFFISRMIFLLQKVFAKRQFLKVTMNEHPMTFWIVWGMVCVHYKSFKSEICKRWAELKASSKRKP